MIVASRLAVFPGCPSYGFTSRPDYLVKCIAREGGVERRDRKWEQALHMYEGAPMGPRYEVDIETIRTFYHAMGGIHGRFRFKDFADYRTADFDQDVAATDQVLEVVDATHWRLMKTYSVTVPGSTVGYETFRRIICPVGSTVLVANEVGAAQPSSSWTIDEDTGILTVEGSFSGVPNSWGGEFYVPCRFDGPLAVQIVNKRIHDLQCSIRELREEE